MQHDGEHHRQEAEVRHKQRHEEHVAEDALIVVLAPPQAQQAAPVQASPGWAGASGSPTYCSAFARSCTGDAELCLKKPADSSCKSGGPTNHLQNA